MLNRCAITVFSASRESRRRGMIHLTRIDPARNMARFYALSLAPTLFGEWRLVKEWGRIGQAGTVRAEAHPDAETAAEALAYQISAKHRRGYIAAGGEPDNATVGPSAPGSEDGAMTASGPRRPSHPRCSTSASGCLRLFVKSREQSPNHSV
jgi:predicted DNA-binding WGR domain protein